MLTIVIITDLAQNWNTQKMCFAGALAAACRGPDDADSDALGHEQAKHKLVHCEEEVARYMASVCPVHSFSRTGTRAQYISEFRDVVFEDVVFDNNRFYLITNILLFKLLLTTL